MKLEMGRRSRASEAARVVLIALLALAAIFGYDVGVIQPREAAATAGAAATADGGSRAVGDSNFTNVVASGNMAMTGTLYAGGAATLNSSASVGTNLTVDEWLILDPADTITITQGATLTAEASYQPITAAGAVSFGAITAETAGTFLRLINVGSNTITISDTGTLKLSGNIALGQYDSLALLSDGTNWIQMGTSDN